MATPAQWIEGARLRTLPLAIAPVIVGSAAAAELGGFHLGRALLALVVSLALQIGVNYANDYSDGIRGTDDVRVGPLRLTGSGAAPAAHVKRAAFACFGVAILAGLALVVWSGTWWLIVVGILAVAAAWFYTGGKKPYGYLGLGEVFVFIFFGLVAVLGTTYTQALTVSGEAWVGAIGCGLISTALLMANNVRDIPTDREVGKHTLAVRLGDTAARWSYLVMVAVAVLLPLLFVGEHPWLALVLLAGALAVKPALTMLRSTERRDLIPVLKLTGILGLVYSVLFAVGLLV
ncbi:1,4-dihydroxy-2-naphthoate polyprenyltransferase [Micrococcus terreus]|uniref:1,4-dihydroxy-2-naphthoate polyprenyltransferase n=1 Tax=Micrococcus terreus TaxID=574650 RepID=UPI0025508E2A|nr:1,4-dihydroxy-2-naphthoate polyprenyltransferase [Micrococcus terreus]MDK7700349.1 1,4-dihydroxy-2-naphthoate polyprenyltransferase [Micrococcus terreus]WOO96508.1 1,4-dihydroxy-2-naphthoate polyprenyltransferase [Micrococcus terreus]